MPWTMGLVGGLSCGRFVELTPFFFGARVFPPPHFFFSFLLSLFLPVLGGSGVLSHGAVFGFFSFISSFFLCGH